MMLVRITSLIKIVNPSENPPWREWTYGSISMDNIHPYLTSNLNTEKKEYNSLVSETKDQHLSKIAYFYKYGWEEPILLIFRENYYPVADGNHRLIAAQLRGDEFILAHVEGNLSLIRTLY